MPMSWDISIINSIFEEDMLRRATSLLTLAAVVCAVGCQDDGLATLEGTVLVNGQPAPKGIAFSFAPMDGGSPSYANTDESGHYEAAFTFRKKGIEPGKHRVHLIPGSQPSSMPQIGADGKPIPTKSAVAPSFPKEYYQEITQIEVSPGSNTIDLEFKSGE